MPIYYYNLFLISKSFWANLCIIIHIVPLRNANNTIFLFGETKALRNVCSAKRTGGTGQKDGGIFVYTVSPVNVTFLLFPAPYLCTRHAKSFLSNSILPSILHANRVKEETGFRGLLRMAAGECPCRLSVPRRSGLKLCCVHSTDLTGRHAVVWTSMTLAHR